ncbi:MAG: hypothetical protein RJA76_799 [Bacteroidota bacterium]|jgi:hypothetical protein
MNRRTYLKNSSALLGLSLANHLIGDLLNAWDHSKTIDWKPILFNDFQAQMVAEIAETICPKTATPGAKELAVPQFIELMVKNVFEKKDRLEFLNGIQSLEDQSKKQFGKSFVQLTVSQKEELLIQLDKDSPNFPATMWGIVLVEKPDPITFFRRIKSLTLMGYFTSEKIAKDVLVYDPIPGKFIPCMPLNGQNAWSE